MFRGGIGFFVFRFRHRFFNQISNFNWPTLGSRLPERCFRPAGGIWENIFGRPAGFGKMFSAGWRASVNSAGRRRSENIFGRNFRSRAQIKDQVMTINSVQFSSKSELSSGTLGRVKVYRFGSVGSVFYSVRSIRPTPSVGGPP